MSEAMRGAAPTDDENDAIDVEAMPATWRYAQQCAGVARREIKGLHPDEREVHNLTVEDCNETLEAINTSGVIDSDETWETLTLTTRQRKVIEQGLVDTRFRKKAKNGGEWEGVAASLPAEHTKLWKSLRIAEEDAE